MIFYIRYLINVKLNKISYILHWISSIDIQYIMQCIRHMNSNITYLQDYYITILDILYLFIRYIIHMSVVTQFLDQAVLIGNFMED